MALFFKQKQPGKINRLLGYRTAASMKNDETWKEANRFSTDLQLKFTIAFIVFEILSFLLIGGITSFYLSCTVLTIISISVIPITEAHLRKNFDKEGKRISN